jgi:predicted alpha/beta-fold hydrolase
MLRSQTSMSLLVATITLIVTIGHHRAMGLSTAFKPKSKSMSMYLPLPSIPITTTTTTTTTSQSDVAATATAAAVGLKRMQEKHRPIASSFVPSPYNPHPILTNCHLQTISGVFLRKNNNCAYISDSGLGGITKVLTALSNIHPTEDICTFWDERQRISTPCGQDFYTVDIKYAGRRKVQFQSDTSNGMVVLIHGLESNSNSSLSTDLAAAYLQDGFDVTCINFRGCCGSPNDTLGGYHLGFTDDLRHFLKLMSELWKSNDGGGGNFDKRPVYLSGFSLGANVVVKCLGELGESAFSLYNIHGAAVCGAPFDAERNVKHLDAPGFNRAIYSANFLKTLKSRAQYQLDMFCNGDPQTSFFDYNGVMSATSIAEFDDAFIAKVYGFEDNLDYYRRSSCCYYLPGVAVPLLIVNAGDDPFFDP